MPSTSLPRATYRLQFNAGFTFDAATGIVAYLASLGVSHCYASSYLKAVPGSTHGYDVVDPTRLNPEIGCELSYQRWIDTLRAHHMGHIVDLVPNHMGIARSANPWWQDVLENGEHSRYADVFDIDWQPLKPELEHKVLLPVLGDVYGAVLERQQIQLEYDAGAFRARYFHDIFPIAPWTYDRILLIDSEALLAEIGADSDDGLEFQSILTEIRHIPSAVTADPVQQAERDRENTVIKRRLQALTERSPRLLAHVANVVRAFNGIAGDSRSFDRLDALLSAQAYRLAYWRVAAEEINYRRFFDINELAAIRIEDAAVFDRVHSLIFDLVKRGCIDGLRIDHVDGLYDPGDYLRRLRARAVAECPDRFSEDAPIYLVVEKILGRDESLPAWPVHGTTGYELLNVLNGLFVDARNERAMSTIYDRFTRLKTPFAEVAYRGKELVLSISMSSELNVLAHRLNRFSERSRHYRDFTLNSLTQAMREIIACFPVYRSYVNEREPGVTARDAAYIDRAVSEAKRRNPNRPVAVYDFIHDLLVKKATYLTPDERDAHMRFVGTFQQVTSPVTAKGIEDTALYLYNRLVSLNDVGGEPDVFGTAPDDAHAWLTQRRLTTPHGLSTTSTHDTKRSEDVRARLNVLSELPGAWKQATTRWARLNRRARTMIGGQSAPSRNEEYILYQTLVGTWPAPAMSADDERTYAARIVAYMHKVMREAKLHTSWLNPSAAHEAAMTTFVEAVLDPNNVAFRDDFLSLQRPIACYGLYNSLAQLTIKVGAPGVADFYQGTEVWDFSLVDPDNRRPVDYAYRQRLLEELDAAVAQVGRATLATRVVATPQDDRLKLYTTATLLRHRATRAGLFELGDYVPVTVEGWRRDHVFAFARSGTAPGERERPVIVVVPRLVAGLSPDAELPPLGERVWGDTQLVLPTRGPHVFHHIFTGARLTATTRGERQTLRLAEVFEHFPVAMLDGLDPRDHADVSSERSDLA